MPEDEEKDKIIIDAEVISETPLPMPPPKVGSLLNPVVLTEAVQAEIVRPNPLTISASVPEFSLKEESGGPWDDPRKCEAAILLASGNLAKKVADKVGVSKVTIWRWQQDPEFHRWTETLRKSLWDSSRGLVAEYVPIAIKRAAQLVTDDNKKIALMAIDKMGKFWQAAQQSEIKQQTNVQINNYGQSGPASSSPPPLNVRDFITTELKMPLTSVYPRILWLLELSVLPEIHEIDVMAGKGAGKTILGSLFMAWLVRNLLTKDDPALSYSLMPGSLMGVINLSVTQVQAQLAVFREFVRRVMTPGGWFEKFASVDANSLLVRFPKEVIAFCGNSSSKGAEGLNWLGGVADEVCNLPEPMKHRVGSSFDDDDTLPAQELVEPIRATMRSRFPRDWKLMQLSWPSHPKDYLHKDAEKAKKNGIKKDLTADFLNCPVTWGDSVQEMAYRAMFDCEPFNQYQPEVVLTNGGILLVKAPVWQLKPDCDKEQLLQEYNMRPYQFSRYCAAAPDKKGLHPFIRDVETMRRLANQKRKHPVKPDGKFEDWFTGDGEFLYFAHCDIGVRKDAAGIAVGHYSEGRCVYDLLLEIKPPPGGEIRIKDLRKYIYDMEKRGFTFSKATQDGFEGISSKQDFEDHGIESEVFSVDRSRKAYDTWLECYYDGVLDYYDYAPYFECAESLVDLGTKIDHTKGGKKDVTDAAAAVCWHIMNEYGDIKD